MRGFLANYNQLKKISQGGMGEIYKAKQISLDRWVVIKKIASDLSQKKEFIDRFKREAKILASLHHPHIVEIYDYGQDEEAYYIVMEFVDGISVEECLQKKLICPEVAVMIIREVGEALRYAHDRKVVHRDIKPANILIDYQGIVKLTDFGISRQVGKISQEITFGKLLGTPYYMAPEQIEGGKITPQTDIFSLGVVFYQLLTSQIPFKGDSLIETAHRIVKGNYISPLKINPLVPPEIGLVVKRCLQNKPEDRYFKVEMMMEELDDFLKKRGIFDPARELEKYVAQPEEFLKKWKEKEKQTKTLTEPFLKKDFSPSVALKKRKLILTSFFILTLILSWFSFYFQQQETEKQKNIFKTLPPLPKRGRKWQEKKKEVLPEVPPPTLPPSPLDSGTREKKLFPRASQIKEKVVVSFFSVPPATLFLNGKKQGVTPLRKLKLFPGRYVLKLQNPLCQDYVNRSFLIKESKEPLSFYFNQELKILPAYLKISAPPGTEVWIGGKMLGKMPFQGLFSLDLNFLGMEKRDLLLKNGYGEWEFVLKHPRGQEKKITKILKPGDITVVEWK